MSAAEVLTHLFDDVITLKMFSEQTGVTRKAVYQKIQSKTWTEREEFYHDPQGKIWISRSGYQSWVKSGSQKIQPELEQKKTPSRSTSASKVKLTIAGKTSIGHPPRLI